MICSDLFVLRGLFDVPGDGEMEPAHAHRTLHHAPLHASPLHAAGHHVHRRGALHFREQHGGGADDGGELQRAGGVAEQALRREESEGLREVHLPGHRVLHLHRRNPHAHLLPAEHDLRADVQRPLRRQARRPGDLLLQLAHLHAAQCPFARGVSRSEHRAAALRVGDALLFLPRALAVQHR